VVRKALGRGLEALIPAAVEHEVPILPPSTSPDQGTPGRDPRIPEPRLPEAGGSAASTATTAATAAATTAATDARTSDIVHVQLSKITRNPAQPRTQFDPATIRELADSIRERGVLQPVLIRPAGDRYQLVAGERRFLAAQEAGFTTIPAIVRPLTDRESLLIALIENVQRENLNPVDEARAYYRLAAEYGLQHEEIAKRVGKDRSTVSNVIRFNNLPPEVLTLMEAGRLSGGHGRALLSLASAKQQIDLANAAASSEWSVRELEARIQRSSAPRVGKPRRAPHRAFSAELLALEDELMRLLGARVRITRRRGGAGSVFIDYHNQEELERVVDVLRTVESGQG
jgi:ParB family chromosome partitioning protein